ncbi:MAG: type IV pilin protein, partial [Thiogranum sp.]
MTGKNTSGFTLIELVIAIAIVGILASIAYPSYVNQMRQTRRADCEAGLMQMASAMERDFSRNNTYRDIRGAPVNFGNQCPIDGGTRTYNLTIASTPTTYVLSAAPVGA